MFHVENNSLEIRFALIVIKTDVLIPDVALPEIPGEHEDEEIDFQEFLYIVPFPCRNSIFTGRTILLYFWKKQFSE